MWLDLWLISTTHLINRDNFGMDGASYGGAAQAPHRRPQRRRPPMKNTDLAATQAM